jgi:hypothetical protein
MDSFTDSRKCTLTVNVSDSKTKKGKQEIEEPPVVSEEEFYSKILGSHEKSNPLKKMNYSI